MHKRLQVLLATLLLFLAWSAPASAEPLIPTYRVTTFSFAENGFPTVADLNNVGQLVGRYTIQGSPAIATAYISVGRELRALPPMPGYSTWATGTTDFGGVVGVASDSGAGGRPDRAFFYLGGQMRDLGTLGGPWARATAVNNADQVIGMSANAAGEARAFLYSEGRMTDLSALVPGNVPITPLDINYRGDITGSWLVDGEPRAFLYRGGRWTDLGDIGGLNATGTRVNNGVTGEATRVDNRIAAFVWTEEAGMREIVFPNDAFQVTGRGINSHGDVVGDGYSDRGPCCTFLWSEGVTASLNDLLEPGSGWSIYQALDINDSGQIAAYGCGAPGCMVVRLDPVPEPSTYVLMLGGLACLLWRGRRRRPGRTGSGTLLALAAGALLAAMPARAAAPARYTITPYPPGGADAYATEMNGRGHMLGVLLRSGGPWVDDGVRSAFLTTGPGYVDIGLVMASFRPAGVNDLGQVAGTATVGVQGRTRAYLYFDGVVSNLGTLGGTHSGASAINNAGQVAGFSTVAGGAEHAFLYQAGEMRDIATLGTQSRANDINERGQVAGHYLDAAGHTRAFIYDNGAMRDLGTLGGDFALATDISNGGHVLGLSRDADGREHSFIYHDGVMTALASGPPGLRALGINSAGDAVGSRQGASAPGAYLWSGGRLLDLAVMVSPQWQVSNPVAINDLGQIAATGCLAGSCSAVLLSPIPEPAKKFSLLAGLGVLLLAWRRRNATCVGQRRQHR